MYVRGVEREGHSGEKFSEFCDLFIVIFSVQDFPFPAAFFDAFLLGFNFFN